MTAPRSTSEMWRWAIGWSLVILVLSCVSYTVAALAEPDGWQFAGIMVNPLDGHSYMAKMQQGVQGKWLFHLTYTPEPHNGAFIFTFYLALGHLAALTDLSKILVFHLARLLAGFGLLLMAFRFITRVTPQPSEQRLAFIFTFSAAGLGWLGVAFGAFPIDLWVPEAFVPYSLYANPHFPLAMMLMLIIFEQILQVSNSSSLPSASLPNSYAFIWSGLAAFALAMILPFALLTVWAILVVFLGWCYVITRRLPWTQIWLTLGVAIFSAPVIFYQYWVSTTNPILAGWGAQNVTAAPKFLDFWLGYGVVGLLVIVGIAGIIRGYKIDDNWDDANRPTDTGGTNDLPSDLPRSRATGEWLVVIWAITTVVLVYFPFDLQRRLITGLHLPFCILAGLGLNRWLAHSPIKLKARRLITMVAIAMGALGTLVVWGLPLIGTLQPPVEASTTALFFMRDEEIAAFEWLQAHVEPDQVILASPRVGMFVPGQTGARAFYGHPFETIDAKNKKAQVEAFYRGEIETVSPAANFIIYGPSEQSLGRPEVLTQYPVVFSTAEVTVYEVPE